MLPLNFQGPFVFWMCYAHPIVVFPVFVMGMLGGLQVLRVSVRLEAFEDYNVLSSLLHTVLPCGLSADDSKRLKHDERQRLWRKRVDFNAGLYIALVCALSIGSLASSILHPNNWVLSSLMRMDGLGLMFQSLLVHSELTVIIGLCLDGGTSVTSKMLRRKCFQFLGRISLSLWLVHMLCIQQLFQPIFNLFHHDIVTRLIIFVITPIIAFILTICFSEPLTKILKN